MQPYQKAAEKIRSSEEYPLQILKQAGLTALGGGAANAGYRAIGKLAPAIGSLINEYIPEKLSMAGLKKIDPRFEKFIQGAMQEGYSYEDIREFIGDKTKKSQEPAKENRSIIEQYSPELHQFIGDQIKRGRSPLEAGAIARSDKKFESAIKKIETDHKAPWSSILQTVYGEGQGAPNQQATQQQMPQEQAQGQGQGQGNAALMAILQKIQQARGQ